MGINYVKGDATDIPEDGKSRILAHICNNKGGFGAGFSGALSRRWKKVETSYREFHKKGLCVLGNIQIVHVRENLFVANMIAQDGYSKPGKPAIRYDALCKCLRELRVFCSPGEEVVMPRIGVGLSGGRWEEIEPLIQEELAGKGITVTVYDL